MAHVVSLTSSDPTVFAPAPLTVPTTITGASPLVEPVVFKPGATPASHSATLTLALDGTDVLCAPPPPPATLTGVGLGGAVNFDRSLLDFGKANCGSTAPAQTITFSNSGNQAYTIATSLDRGASSPYLVSTCQGGVVGPSGGTCAITVTPQAIPGTSAVTPNLYGDLLTVTTNVPGDSPHYFPLKLTAQGAIVGLERSAIDFGSVFAGSTVKYVYGVTNTGNQPISLDLTQTGSSAIFNLTGIAVAAHDAKSASILFTPQAAGSTYSAIATVAPHAGQVLCKPLPFSSITLSGSGAGTNLELPSSLEFAPLPCGGSGTGAPQTFSVGNPTSAPFKVTAALGKTGSSALFTVSPVGQQTIAAQQKLAYTLTPLAIPATAPTQLHAIADVLTISTTLAGDSPHPRSMWVSSAPCW